MVSDPIVKLFFETSKIVATWENQLLLSSPEFVKDEGDLTGNVFSILKGDFSTLEAAHENETQDSLA